MLPLTAQAAAAPCNQSSVPRAWWVYFRKRWLAPWLTFFLPAIAFLLVEPYKKNRFVRFHSFQCLGFFLVGVVVVATLRVLGFFLFFVPVIGHALVWLVSMVVALAFFMVWVVLIVKALQGEMFKLPLVGEFAEQQTPAG